jgi:hypothetical protein
MVKILLNSSCKSEKYYLKTFDHEVYIFFLTSFIKMGMESFFKG